MRSATILLGDQGMQAAMGLAELGRSLSNKADVLLAGWPEEAMQTPQPGKDGQVVRFCGAAAEKRFDMWPLANVLAGFCADRAYECILLPAGEDGNRLAPMLSALLHGSCLLDVLCVHAEDNGLCADKLCYNLNMTATFSLKRIPAVLSVTERSAQACVPAFTGDILSVPCHAEEPAWYTGETNEPSGETEGIRSAKDLLVAGRGSGGRAGYERLCALAPLLHAEIASTRPPVLEAIAPHSRLVGVSGSIVSPARCVVVGASGAAPFARGIEGSQTIFGVNEDPSAQLFSMCDYGVVADSADFTDALEELLVRR